MKIRGGRARRTPKAPNPPYAPAMMFFDHDDEATTEPPAPSGLRPMITSLGGVLVAVGLIVGVLVLAILGLLHAGSLLPDASLWSWFDAFSEP